MDELTTLFERYLEVWNTRDEDFIRQRITETWCEGGRFVDPMEDVLAIEPLVQHVRRVQTQFPNLRYGKDSDIDAHHDVVRYRWKITDGDNVIMNGMDTCVVEDGRIRTVIGWFTP